MLKNKRHIHPFITLSILLGASTVYALEDSLQLKLERAGRLIASTYVIGNPDEKLFGLHPDYTPKRPSDMIHKDIEITIKTEHSIQETKEKVVTVKGFSQFEKWLKDVRSNYPFPDNLKVKTMGVCIDDCCRYPIDGGMFHNSLYLTEACFSFKNNMPFLKSILLLDGD